MYYYFDESFKIKIAMKIFKKKSLFLIKKLLNQDNDYF